MKLGAPPLAAASAKRIASSICLSVRVPPSSAARPASSVGVRERAGGGPGGGGGITEEEACELPASVESKDSMREGMAGLAIPLPPPPPPPMESVESWVLFVLDDPAFRQRPIHRLRGWGARSGGMGPGR